MTLHRLGYRTHAVTKTAPGMLVILCLNGKGWERMGKDGKEWEEEMDGEINTKEETEQFVMLPNCKLVPGDL